MATTVWNVKLLGGITEQDFNNWLSAANVPTGYQFSVNAQDDQRGNYWTPETGQSSTQTVFIPDTDDTIVVAGISDDYNFQPVCFEGHRCSMFAGLDDFTSGTELFALILSSDGLLGHDILNQLFDAVDLGAWIKKNQPSAYDAYNNAEYLVDANGEIDETNPDGEKLKNAICQYVVAVLGIWKSSNPTK